MKQNPQPRRPASEAIPSRSQAWQDRLFAPVDNASIAVFRICFGAIMLWEVGRYFGYGWIKHHWIDPQFLFKFYGFEWVVPWPGNWMYLHFMLLGALAVCITLGLWYRASTILFFPAFAYIFLLDSTWYLNHFYLITLVSLLMIFIPAHRTASLDALRDPGIRSDRTPAWTLWLLQFQVGVVYFFGGVAKLNMDWLRGEPMRTWLGARTDFPLIGSLFTEEPVVYLFSYGGLLLDLFAAPLLLWPRTRNLTFAVTLVFHLMNAQLFNIGIFPWFMICATLLFYSPDWPRRVGLLPQPGTGKKPKKLARKDKGTAKPAGVERPPSSSPILEPWIGRYVVIALLGVYVAYHFLMPMRHLLYPGDVNWSGEGLLFSWRMKLSDKRNAIKMFATNPVRDETWEVDPADYLGSFQLRKMTAEPDLLRQFSHFLADRLREEGHEQIEVRAEVTVRLNRREPQLLIDPTEDLAAQPGGLGPASWILPLEQPFVYRKAGRQPATRPQELSGASREGPTAGAPAPRR